MRWVPSAAAAWALAYGLMRIGTWEPGPDALPLAFFLVAMPAYLVWGLGLGAAAFGYYQATRPSCSVCAR
jgi:hypothetical protein